MTRWPARSGGGRSGGPRARAGDLARVLALVAAVLVARAAPGSELRVGVPRLPASLDPAAVAPRDLLPLRFASETLVRLTEDGDLAPGLATAWGVSRDGLTWTFRLRADARLHDGSLLTAPGVAAALARHLGPELPDTEALPWLGPFRGPAAVIRQVRAEPDGRVAIQLHAPFSPLPALLAHPALAVVATRVQGEPPVLGTGPYGVVERVPGRLVLGATGVGPPGAPARLVFMEVPDEATAVGLLTSGALDVYLPGRPPGELPESLRSLAAPTWTIGLLVLRSDEGPLARRGARQGVAAALDPVALQAALLPWAGPWASLLPPGLWGAEVVGRGPAEPERARKLLAQAAVGDRPLRLLVPDTPEGFDRRRLAGAIGASLGAVGLTVEPRLEGGEAFERALRHGEAELALHEVSVEVADPHFVLRPLAASDAAVRGRATNPAFYRSALVDDLLRRAGQVAFRPERLRLYRRVLALLREEAPYVPLYVRLQWAVARPGVQGLRLAPGGLHPLDRVSVER